jgi:hypothetical protein
MSGSPDALSVSATIMRRLRESGLGVRSGKLLYSDLATLSPGELYVLGYNPGGDPKAEPISVAEEHANLAGRPKGWNEYLHGVWLRDGREQLAGSMPMQKRTCYLLRSLGLDVRSVCASNLIFVRSKDINTLRDRKKLAEECWPIHQLIFDIVRPKAILCIGGNEASKFLHSRANKLSNIEPFPSGHGDWKCSATTGQIGSSRMSIVRIPHLSRYAIDRYPEVVHWVRKKLGL